MTDTASGAPAAVPAPAPKLPPRWFVRSAWVVHRALYRVTGGRFGLARPRPGKFGMLRLQTIGCRSGQPRIAIVSYYEEGDALVTMAMNGWADAHPAWLHNLRAQPDASVDLPDGPRLVRAREVTGLERERLLAGFDAFHEGPAMAEYERARRRATPVIVLEPRAA